MKKTKRFISLLTALTLATASVPIFTSIYASETEPETQLEAQIGAEPETQLETEPEAESETQFEIQQETESETQFETQPETEPETQAQTQPETEPETQAQTQPKTEPETQAQTQPETEPETEAQTQPETEEETQPEQKETNPVPAKAISEEQSDFLYRLLSDGTIEILGYSGNQFKNLTIPSTIDGYTVSRIGDNAFYLNTSFTGKLVLPEGLKSIGKNAFYGCIHLEGTLTLPSTLTQIGENAFGLCYQFTGTLTLPGGLTFIGANAFENLTQINKIENLSSVALDLFQFGSNRSWYHVENQAPIMPDALSLNHGTAVEALHSIQSVTCVKDTIKSGETVSFYASCTPDYGTLPPESPSVTWSSSDENIAVVDTDGVVTARQAGEATITATLPNGSSSSKKISVINNDFEYEILPDNTLKITGYIGPTNGHLVIPDTIDGYTVSEIGDSAFKGKSFFHGKLVLPKGLIRIGSYAFYNCYFYGTLDLPENLISIGDYAFYWCDFSGTLDLPENLVSIGEYAFSSCNNFTGTLNFPDSLTSIGAHAFEYCKGFSGSLILPDGLETVGRYAFYECTGFTGDLVLPKNLTYIETATFAHCTGFHGTLSLPENLETISFDAFKCCSGLSGTLNLPTTLRAIFDRAFGDCKGFTGTLTLPESLQWIGEHAFNDCSGFSGDLILPESLRGIEVGVFYGCNFSNITLVLPQNLIELDEDNFKDMPNLNRIEILCSASFYISDSGFGEDSYWYQLDNLKLFPNLHEREIIGPATILKTLNTVSSVKCKESTLDIGEQTSLEITSTPDIQTLDPEILNIIVSSSNEHVVTVKDGVVEAIGGGKATITVKAGDGSEKSCEVFVNGPEKIVMEEPTIVSVSAPANVTIALRVTWKPVERADGYIIYRKIGNGSWERIKKVAGQSKDYYSNISLQPGTKYTYSVQSFCKIDGKVYYSDKYTKPMSAVSHLKTPSLVSATCINESQIKIRWTPVPNAQGYRIYRKEAGSNYWTLIRRIPGQSKYFCIDSDTRLERPYFYTVQATCSWDGELYTSEYNETGVPGKTSLGASNINTISLENGNVILTWKQIPKAQGYVVMRSTSPNGTYKKIRTAQGVSDTAFIDKNLPSGTYYYKVRAFRQIDSKFVYGAYSDVRSITK